MLRPRVSNMPPNILPKLIYTKHTKLVAFTDDLAIIVEAESIEVETFVKIEINKIAEWAADNKIRN